MNPHAKSAAFGRVPGAVGVSGALAPDKAGIADRVMVPFRGEGAGSDELAWGQRELWSGMVRQRSWFPIGITKPLPQGTTVEDLAGRLGYLMGRHQTMRTRLKFDDACESNRNLSTSDGRVRQVVFAEGEIPLEIVDVGDEGPATVAAQVEQRYRDTDYDFAHEWPVRTAVVRQWGRPTHQVVILCHLVTDGFGAATLAAELAGRRPATGRPVGAKSVASAAGLQNAPASSELASAPDKATGMPPLAQARWQRSPAGQRQNQQALRYWERLLRTIPAQRFRGSDDPRQPPFWQARLNSPGMHLAAQAVAARTGADTSTVLLAAFVVAQARISGIDPTVTRVMASNRFRTGLADVVAPVSQPALCMVEVAGASFDEVVARIRRTTMAAYKYAYYDTFALEELIDRVDEERGERLDLSCFFNDRRSPSRRGLADRPPSRAELREALPRTRFQWGARIERSERLFLHIEDVPDTVSIAMWADTRHTSPTDIEHLLLTMEATLVDAAFDPAAVRGAP